MSELSLSVTETDGRIVITVSGDLDITYAARFTALAAEQVPGGARAIVDLTTMEFLDSAGLGALLNLWKRLQRGGGDMVLVGASYRSARALWVTGLADRLPRTDSLEEALER
ncbi:STAS domain-containing protein [Actinomadura hibisca]|uniref:STAS domain-containing protein n=1 Tax=Actinomadura hibisca TaxID=68565 RepID=UPI00082AD20D|nr:STAS domain-containing protein [Actinomadura hibisca]